MPIINKLKGSSTKGIAPQTDNQLMDSLRKYVELAERKEEGQHPANADSNNDELNALLTRLSSVVHKREEYYKVRLNMITEAIEVALWEMDVFEGDPVNPNNEFWWSDQFRKTIGFEGEHDFPNLLSSWSNQLHPEDSKPTLDAFANHLNDYTGQTDYNVNPCL
ncbi:MULTISPECIES: PAS domain-containing protein [unclassified Paenibacillus]|uniref:PAS domain-containing protein n=1 Tax=unclassified Paenibacillus TaxID=185978 RepID=UPI0024064842|nr:MULTISPECIES: PAS domain-containing protein [unclassified Paenibacillus]MDF9839766.1 hypothetical protein [Paenibacillus sp. PastF-2]MDF9846346.1 hypothetical protein [Paenibacillus sp. PastM-2]MDF9853304.1 hypothetical protein [Paenibacillus sp. PastF-1]MDH6478192.1 hypothetical protein [Paenibacillus sp. PastH-2]MDH6506309.1 hypothetical protein [Paenibacillus sp. PastM-3]